MEKGGGEGLGKWIEIKNQEEIWKRKKNQEGA